MNFRTWFEATDIFGFENQRPGDERDDNMLARPINQFDLELMMDLLSRKSIGLFEAFVPFVSEIRWGNQPGSVKLEVDTGCTFIIKRLGVDKIGNPRWITKRLLQLNRQGYGGMEDAVAQEVHNHLARCADGPIDGPKEYSNDDLENLAVHVNNKIKRTAKNIFIPMGIKKLQEYAYVLSFEVRGSGVESPGHQRVENNQTMISYDPEQGTIRITNYNIESSVGKAHSWTLAPIDLDLYFFPTQDREEISECLAVHYKYY
jgi:hypothetical protein